MLWKNPPVQRLGDLPEDRITIAAPFEVSGLDIFGHFNIRHGGRGTHKRWVLLATCLVTRAVCLLPLRDMTLGTVINALVKMNSQFPSLKKVYSDNGSNFRGADREIREAVEKWDKNEFAFKLSEKGIDWQFGPASCGSAGGVWERIIGITKKLIKSVIGDKILDLDTFETLIAGVMAIMNRRPLMQASSDVDDDLVLTPSHFLYPHLYVNSSTSILPPSTENREFLRSSWRASQSILDKFWEQWKTQYLTTLTKKSKWLTSTDGPHLNQIVLIKDDNSPRELWRKARVTEILNSDPSHPRRFKLKDSKGSEFDRHITGLIPLEFDA